MTEAVARWRGVRRVLTARRQQLTEVAAALYPELPRVGPTGLLCRADWLPDGPLEVDELELGWTAQPPPVPVPGTGPQAAHVLPGSGEYACYAEAVGVLDRPALYENRPCYRLLDASLAGPPTLSFAPSWYFDATNLGGAVGHELAAGWQAGAGQVSLADLPLRAAVGDPCTLSRRDAICAVTTLTLRRDPGGAASFVLHWRDPARVNHAGGMYQVMPAGIFQPVTGEPAAQLHDLSIWRCLVREFSEELLGAPEEYPVSGGLLDYGRWPLHERLAAARAAGTLRVSCVGLGADPVTLATDILTVAVFDGDLLDSLAGGLVLQNSEGRVVTQDGSAWIPFCAENIDRFTGGTEPVQAAGAALLWLAWQHRHVLLG